MVRFTTNSTKYQSEVKRLLIEDFDVNWKPLWCYFEMTQPLTNAYSLTLLIKGGISTRKLLLRNWKNNLTTEIFHLDNIIINEKEFGINLNDTFEIQELIKREINTVETELIVLGGYVKEFIDFKVGQNYKWNIDEQMNEHLETLIMKIKQIITAK